MMSRPGCLAHVRASVCSSLGEDRQQQGLRSTGAVRCGASQIIQRVSDYRLSQNLYQPIAWDASSLKFGAVFISPCFSHPLDDDLPGRCACLKCSLTFASAQQHRSIVKRCHRSAPAPAAAPNLPASPQIPVL